MVDGFHSGGSLRILSGTANPELAEAIASALGTKLSSVKISRFSDGELYVRIEENVRGADVFVIQPTCYPGDKNLMELLIMLDALKRASAARITAVIPYYGYARQDRKTQGREPITAKLVANLITTAGADRVLTCDLHAGQIQGFFDIPLDHLTAIPLLADYFLEKLGNRDDVVVVSPDVGGVVRARRFAEHLRSAIAIVDKRRPREIPNVSEVMEIVGDVSGKIAIIVDDIIDTAGTIVNAANAILERGAKEVYACATHGVLSGNALERLSNSPIKEVLLTDTIPISPEKRIPKIKIKSIASLFAEAIRRIHYNLSVSMLFKREGEEQ
ncbi:MAG: ribose-phosphate pyrophosphokinase [Synergistetes bacterium]|nr:MAG: Ribose-phosphate pyrophosphokinase [bacterium 42_11]MBC7331706.1 ribose-phosphate pyrophosphokinase [Synergistota bacterium]MDK2872094.1 ribose-phosphate pyrophosphokinae [bacterium]